MKMKAYRMKQEKEGMGWVSASLYLWTVLGLGLFLVMPTISVSAKPDRDFVARVDRTLLGLKKEKLSHFRLYWHDIVGGRNATAVPVVRPPSNSSTAFGMISVIDDPITLGPALSSKLVGRAQGLYAAAAQDQVGLLMAMNFAFTEGKYNGSSISILGRNTVFSQVREMPIIGGSGLFRFARGYVEARTHRLDLTTGDATVEYNCYVMHY